MIEIMENTAIFDFLVEIFMLKVSRNHTGTSHVDR